jgi:hypothetical protein
MRPVHETGVGGHVVETGAKLPERYLERISLGCTGHGEGQAYGCLDVDLVLLGPVVDITAVLLAWRHWRRVGRCQENGAGN